MSCSSFFCRYSSITSSAICWYSGGSMCFCWSVPRRLRPSGITRPRDSNQYFKQLGHVVPGAAQLLGDLGVHHAGVVEGLGLFRLGDELRRLAVVDRHLDAVVAAQGPNAGHALDEERQQPHPEPALKPAPLRLPFTHLEQLDAATGQELDDPPGLAQLGVRAAVGRLGENVAEFGQHLRGPVRPSAA